MSVNSSWIILVIAGLFEVVWAIGIKYTQGFTRLGPSIFTLVSMGISFYLLSKATVVLPIGTAYGVWVGIGALGAAVVGILFLNESANPARIFFLSLLLVAVIGLKFTSE